MNALAGYGSGSDDDDSVDHSPIIPPPAPPVQVKPPNPSAPSTAAALPPASSSSSTGRAATAVSSAASLPGQKKVKKLDISFLPPEIQAALARGGNASDSDSDEEQGKPLINNNNSTGRSEYSRGGGGNERTRMMLDQLPKPQALSESRGRVVVPPASTPSAESSNLQDRRSPSPPMPTSSFSFHPASGASGGGQIRRLHSAAGFSVDSRSSASSSSASVGATINEPSYLHPIRTNICAAPPTKLPLPGPELGPQYDPAATSIYGNNYLSASNYPATSNAAHSAPGPSRQTYSAPPAAASSFKGGGKNSRKREREIQEELMRGNVGVVEHSQFVDMSAGGWDSSKYNEQQQREAEVQSMFGMKAGANLIAMPTKQQNRKHQINSLAMSAASVELELMEARGQRSKSKAETQGKYGW